MQIRAINSDFKALVPRLKLAVVRSLFNEDITEKLERGALDQMLDAGFNTDQIVLIRVAGAFEIPLAAQWAFEKMKVDGVIALGAVIRGETSHYDYVCNAVERGCSEVALKFSKPVSFGVLTTENDEQAMERVGGRHGHKGREAAQVALEMCAISAQLA